jgi:hypothetical protein
LYAPDRKAERPASHLEGFKGVLHVDGYAGFERLAINSDVVLAACWAHARRKFQRYSFVILQQLLRRLQSQSLRDLGTEANVEVGFADPHSMQDTCELARDRDDRAQHARSFGYPQPQARKADHFRTRRSRLAAASHSASRTATSPCLLIRPS